MEQQPAAAPSSKPTVALQMFDVLIAVRVYNAPRVTPEQIERVFDLDLRPSDWPESSVKTRTINVERTGGRDAGSKT